MRFALALPILMAVFFGGVMLFGACRVEVSRQEVIQIIGELRLRTFPEFKVLTIVLCAGAALLFLIAAGLLALVLRCARLS
jgi:hypothetical protein